MNKIEIYNKALDLCGQQPITEDDINASEKDQTIKTLDTWYMAALRKASREMAWPFLSVKLNLGNDLGSAHSFEHSYMLDVGVEQVSYCSGERFQRFGRLLCVDFDPCEGELEVWGVLQDIIPPDSNIPEDFSDFVAIALAYFASVRLSPDTATRQAINSLYQDKKNELITYYLQDERSERIDWYYGK